MYFDFGLKAQYALNEMSKDEADASNLPKFLAHGFENKASQDCFSLYLEITSKSSDSWIAALTGDISNPQVEGVYACPSEKHCLVVVNSNAFLINTARKGDIIMVGDCIRKVEKYLFLDLLLLMDYVSITAIGKNGVLWKTPRLVRDGVSVSLVSDEFIYGEGDYSHSNSDGDCFKLNTETGRVIQGNIFTESEIQP